MSTEEVPRIPAIAIVRYTLTSNLRVSVIATALAFAIAGPVLELVYWWRDALAPFIASETQRDALLFTLVSVICHVGIIGGATLLVNYWDRTGTFKKFKLKRYSHQAVSDDLYNQTLTQTLKDWFVGVPLGAYLIYMVLPFPDVSAPLPSVPFVFGTVFADRVISELIIYCYHRLYHAVPFLAKLHSIHHQWQSCTPLATEFSHAFDALANNISTTAYILMNAPRIPFPLWIVLASWIFYESAELHSGYAFNTTWPYRIFGLTFADRTEFHDFHHTHDKGNFGSAFLWDYVFGTMDAYIMHMKRQNRLVIDGSKFFIKPRAHPRQE